MVTYEIEAVKQLGFNLVKTTLLDILFDKTSCFSFAPQVSSFAVSIIEFVDQIRSFLNFEDLQLIDVSLTIVSCAFGKPCGSAETIKNALQIVELAERFEFDVFGALRRKSDAKGSLSFCSSAFNLRGLREKLESLIL